MKKYLYFTLLAIIIYSCNTGKTQNNNQIADKCELYSYYIECDEKDFEYIYSLT